MKQKIFLFSLLLLAVTACNKKEPAENVKPKAVPEAKSQGIIAYVEIDSLATAYTYCIDGQKELQAKQQNYRSQLDAKANSLQNAVASFQKKMQNGTFSSQSEAENEQKKIQRQQQQLQQFQERIEGEMASAAEQYQKVLRDSLASFIKDFNKDGRYSMILSKSGDNILYADKSLDITKAVIDGLNKRYKKKK